MAKVLVEDYVRNATVLRVIDGDTVELLVDLGFSVCISQKIRLMGVDCPEKFGATRAAGMAAKAATTKWLAEAKVISLQTYKNDTDGKFGRYMGSILNRTTGESLGEFLLKNGFAVRK